MDAYLVIEGPIREFWPTCWITCRAGLHGGLRPERAVRAASWRSARHYDCSCWIIMLPGIEVISLSGVCATMPSATPIIHADARGAQWTDRLKGLKQRAQMIPVRAFALSEWLARHGSHVLRPPGRRQTSIQVADLQLRI